jgi:hypothetical protein
MVWYKNLSVVTITVVAGAIAAVTWCLKLLFYTLFHSLARSKEEKETIAKIQEDMESADDVGRYVAPSSKDDRAPCPALNAMANHGYL